MADILIQPAVPSLFTHTESASNLIVDSPTADSNNNTAIHHNRTSPNNNSINNSNNPNATNKYIGHVSRLRSVFNQYAITLNDLKSGEHRSRYCNHQENLASPIRSLGDGADESSLSPPTQTLPLATTSSSTIIERSRSLSNPRILDTNKSQMNSMRNGISSLTMTQTSSTSNTSNDDHTMRFRKAREMFQTLEEEAARTTISLTTATVTTTKQIKTNEQFDDESFEPDLMHDKQKISTSKINAEHIPDLIIDHRQQQHIDYFLKHNETNTSRVREIPVQFISTTTLPSPTNSDRSVTSIPIHRAAPPPPSPPMQQTQTQTQTPLVLDEDVHYATVNRKQIHSDQHYDFPADAIEQLKKHQRDENDLSHNMPKPSNEDIANRIVASILPSNILKRMDHLNTVFIKPTTIERTLPILSFSENDTQQTSANVEEKNEINHLPQEQEEEIEQKWIENPMLNSIS